MKILENYEDRLTELTTLAGGFNVRLTPADRNEWHEFLEDNTFAAAAWVKYNHACATYEKFLRNDASEMSLLAATDDVHTAKRALYSVGKLWAEDLRARKQEAAETEDKTT